MLCMSHKNTEGGWNHGNSLSDLPFKGVLDTQDIRGMGSSEG